MIAPVTVDPQVTVLHTGSVFRVERLSFPADAAAGRPALVRDVVRHPGAVAVVAVRDDGQLVLVRNRRVAVGRALLEFCAGKLERGEDPAHAAARELEEETGYSARNIRPLGRFYTSPGFADELMHVYLATGLSPVPQRLEEGEDLEVVILSPEALRLAIATGEIVDGKTLGAYLLHTMHGGAS